MDKKLDSIMVGDEATLSDAITVLNDTGLRIVLVVDAERRLLGTVTDGDIRRALIKQAPLDSLVRDAMNANPRTMPYDAPADDVLALMRAHDLVAVPLLLDGQVVSLKTMHGIVNAARKDNPVFLMAGGFGKRLYPLTKDCPKPLLYIGDKPIIELIVERFVSQGYWQFYVSTHYRSDMLREHLGDGERWGASITYIYEEQPLGTGGALGLLPDDIPALPLIVINGDILTEVDFDGMFGFHQETGSLATMAVREFEEKIPFGVVLADGHMIKKVVEKPVNKYFINAGIYILEQSLARSVEKNTRIDMPTLLENAIKSGEKIAMFPVHEYWMDIGSEGDFEQAQIDFGQYFK